MMVCPSAGIATQLLRHTWPATKVLPLLVPPIWKNRSRFASYAGPRAHGLAPLTVQPLSVSGCCEQDRLKMCLLALARSIVVTRPCPWFEAYRYVWPFFVVAMVSAELLLPPPVLTGQPPVLTSVPSPTLTLCTLPSLALR